MCAKCDRLRERPENYSRQGYTFCDDFVMPTVAVPPSQPATPPPARD